MQLKDRENKINKSPVKSLVSEMDSSQKEENKLSDVATKDKTKRSKLRQQSYYLDESHIKAIEMRLYKNKMDGKGVTDKSALVRAALDKYLKDELKEIKDQDSHKE